MNDLIERLNMLAGRMMATTLFGKDAHTILEASSVLALQALPPEPLPSVMLEALDITREAVAAQVEGDALALLRELNDALVIPKGLQLRVDAVLDRAEEK